MSRQSSGGKSSFFSRRNRTTQSIIEEDGSDGRPSLSESNSQHGSVASRQSRRPSEPFNEDSGVDATGLSMTAGVLTSIPYDSVAADSRKPRNVEFLPRNEDSRKRETQPHHLNKAGSDFHQYPAWEPSKSMPPPAGPRQLPPIPSTATSYPSSRDRQSKASTYEPSPYDPTKTRPSFDAASIASKESSYSGRLSMWSTDQTIKGSPGLPPAIPPHVQDYNPRPISSHSSSYRMSNASSFMHYPSHASFAPEGFQLSKPSDDKVIESEFVKLMTKRGWHNLPDSAKRQMLAYTPSKKWTLIHQDQLTEWQGQQKRNKARYTQSSLDGIGILAKADEEGSPEWYVKKIMEDSMTQKQFGSLSVSLRTQPIK